MVYQYQSMFTVLWEYYTYTILEIRRRAQTSVEEYHKKGRYIGVGEHG